MGQWLRTDPAPARPAQHGRRGRPERPVGGGHYTRPSPRREYSSATEKPFAKQHKFTTTKAQKIDDYFKTLQNGKKRKSPTSLTLPRETQSGFFRSVQNLSN